MTEINKKIQMLKKITQDKTNNTLIKVTTTLSIMKEKSLPVNFESVAKLAGVSKTWLYRQPELSKEISELRHKTGKIKRMVDLQSILLKKDEEIIKLKEKNTHLKQTIEKLRNQLEIVYGEFYNQKKI